MRKTTLFVKLLNSGAYKDAEPEAMELLTKDVVINPLKIMFLIWIAIGLCMFAYEAMKLWVQG